MRKYYKWLDPDTNMLHAWQYKDGDEHMLHVNVTALHVNKVNHVNTFDNSEQITEDEFNQYKYHVLKSLEVI